MIAFVPEPITLDFSSIPEEYISDFDKMEGLVLGATRQYNNRIYETLQTIHPLVDYIWHDADPIVANHHVEYLETETTEYANGNGEVLVTVYLDDIVFRVSEQKYYKSKRNDIEIDFVTETSAPENWDDLGTSPDFRIDYIYPSERKTTLNWTDKGATNRYVMFDGSLNKQSTSQYRTSVGANISFDSATKTVANTSEMEFIVGDRLVVENSTSNDGVYHVATVAGDNLSFTVEETLVDEAAGANISLAAYVTIRFTVTGMDRLAVFNTSCEEVNVKVTLDDGTVIFEEAKEMYDTSEIIDFETFVFDEIPLLPQAIWTVPRDYSAIFEITFVGAEVNIGEVMVGKSIYLGQALDTVTLKSRSYSKIVETDDGEVYFDEEDSQLKVKDEVAYEVKVDSTTLGSQLVQNKKLINKRLVVAGTDSDNEEFRYLITYGFGKDFNVKAKTSNTKSHYSFVFYSFL